MKLLIVEDNQLLAASLKSLLQSTYIVDLAYSGAQCIELATSTTYQAIILDLNLPDMNGADVCRELRARNVATPIIVATGESDPARCVELLDMGADDYVIKPYDMEVLGARVRALLRRQPHTRSANVITVQDLRIDTDRRHVERNGKAIPLRKKEFDILTYLAQNRGKAVTRPMILNHAWEAGKDTWNNTVDVHIKYLRDKVDRPFEKPLIKTAYGVGYIIED